MEPVRRRRVTVWAHLDSSWDSYRTSCLLLDLVVSPNISKSSSSFFGHDALYCTWCKWRNGCRESGELAHQRSVRSFIRERENRYLPGTPAKRKKLGCQGLQREFKYMNASLYLHMKRMYSTLVTFCRNPVSYLVQNAKIICTTLMQGNVPDQ